MRSSFPPREPSTIGNSCDIIGTAWNERKPTNFEVFAMATVRKRTWKSGQENKTAWIADYFDQEGRRHIKTCKTKKEADASSFRPGMR